MKRLLRIVKSRKFGIQDEELIKGTEKKIQNSIINAKELTAIAESNGILLDVEDEGSLNLPNTNLARKVIHYTHNNYNYTHVL